jgi:two-component system phosphate regulon response regulator PhoB
MSKVKSPGTKKILIVEDDPDILHVINIMLGLEGYQVETLLDGKSILQNEAELPDLYILDKLLPYADGSEICQFLKSQPATKDIPVIMISSSARSKNSSLEAGAAMFIEKPFLMHNFLHKVAKALNVPQKNKWFGL